MKTFKWNAEKNDLLLKSRGITFEEVVQKIDAGAHYTESEHPNTVKYESKNHSC